MRDCCADAAVWAFRMPVHPHCFLLLARAATSGSCAVQGADAPGVSCPGNIGLSAAEALDMCFVAGSNPRVRLFDLSEFNPAVDDYRTGRLVANMWYWFCMGVASRK